MTSPDFSASSLAVSDEELAKAAAVIRGGGVVAFPTETFYGLAVDPFKDEALARLFRLKERSRDKPVLVLIDKIEKLHCLAKKTPDQYLKIIAGLWPGPLTLVFAGLEQLPALLTDSSGTVGVRLSSHPVARRLAKAVGGVITGTSANPSGLPPAVTSAQVNELFPVGIDHVIDGGLVPGGTGSTIIGIEGDGLKLIRAGSIPYEDIIATI
ncbi:MAG: L-threonylcarbamoyladenylate synthase [Thermodesulfobacteriota bacterium]